MNVKLNSIKDIVVHNTDDVKTFTGYTTTKHKDINGDTYELKDSEEKYYLVKNIDGNPIFFSETYLLNILLGEYIDNVKDGGIYSHGYPESRLIPSDFYEDCQDHFLENVIENITDKVTDILDDYFI